MIATKIKIKRKPNKAAINRLFKKLRDLDKESVQIGYPKGAGWHKDADMPYASLAYMHAHGFEYGFTTRNVFKYMKPSLAGNSKQKTFFKNLLTKYLDDKNSFTRIHLFNAVGEKYMQDGKQVFGNPSYLTVTNNPTPLVDTGALQKAFGYRTTINYKYKN